jgi:hypothetical protein
MIAVHVTAKNGTGVFFFSLEKSLKPGTPWLRENNQNHREAAASEEVVTRICKVATIKTITTVPPGGVVATWKIWINE